MPRSRIAIASLIGLAGLAAIAARSRKRAPTRVASAAPFDLQRYMGRWHVIARVPYFAERGHVASVEEYALQPDGHVGVRYSYRTGFSAPLKTLESSATVKPGRGNREWTAWFFRSIPTRYRILEVAPDYSWALIDYPGRDLAWIFARAPVIDEGLYRELGRRLAGYGVDADKLRRVPQVADQPGTPGFETPDA